MRETHEEIPVEPRQSAGRKTGADMGADILTQIEEWIMTSKTAKALILVLVLYIIGHWIFQAAVFTVPPGHRGVVFSRSEGVKPVSYGEGWHVIVPVLETYDIVDCRVLNFNIQSDAASKDMQTVKAKISVNYHVDASKAHQVYQQIGSEYEKRVIEPAVEEAVRAVTARYTAEELITKREEVALGIRDLISEKLSKFSLIVDAFNIINFDFSPDFNHAIEQKQIAEQEAARENNVLTKVQIQAKQKVAEAEGIRQAAIIQAEGQANATVLNAEAQAKSIQLQAEALKTNQELIELKKIERWDGRLPQFIGGGTTPIIDFRQMTGTST